MEEMYLLTMFYQSLASVERTVRETKEEVASASGNEYKVITFGPTGMCISFISDVPTTDLQKRFHRVLGDEGSSFLLVQVSKVVAGWIPGHGMDWLAKQQFRRGRKS